MSSMIQDESAMALAISPAFLTTQTLPPGFDAAEAARYGEFVAAAYLMFNNGNAPLKPTPAGVPAGYTLHDYIIMSDFLIWGTKKEAFYGYIATKEDGSESIVATRGTVGGLEWLDNLHASFMPFVIDQQQLGLVHSGFGRIYQTIDVRPAGSDSLTLTNAGESFADKAAAAISRARGTKLLAAAAAPRTVVVAHSLGAALMTQYILENATKRPAETMLAYTLASPRVGDQSFVNSYQSLGNVTTWRVHNKPDLVPNIPPDVWGYRHVATDTEINDNGSVQDTVSCHHNLQTYLHVLAPAQYPVPSECSRAAVMNLTADGGMLRAAAAIAAAVPPQPNPGSTFRQLESTYTIYQKLAAARLGPNVLLDLQKLIGLANDPELVRLGYTIRIASAKYGQAEAKPLGWYATIALHNSAIDAGWDGGSDANPYGSPNTPV